jgi:nanoRNase/pAp phosphatase (c-di-AMP/oligoRNAs hydrolase)
LKYFIFIDCDALARVARSLASEPDAERIWVAVAGYEPEPSAAGGETIVRVVEVTGDLVKSLGIAPENRIIVGARQPDRFIPLTQAFSPDAPAPSILFISEKPVSAEAAARPNVSVVNLVESARAMLSGEWRDITTRKRAFRLWSMLHHAGRVLILVQNDPDPDAIASGMAVQALLAMKDDTAPICTFGRVTRNENRAMLRLLGAKVRTIRREEVADFDKVVMVDVQPPYFKGGAAILADAVIDHHPYPPGYHAPFKTLDTTCGATATIMTEFLSAAGVEINARLATALLYGVITDTMLLAREASTRDFAAFNILWPLADHELLAAMSRPKLRPEELDYFVRAIQEREEVGGLLIIWLGVVKKEDIIPRIADFSMQIGETSVCAVGGVHKGQVVISIRSVDPELDAGAMASRLFGGFGSAGGHKTMAKAVMPLGALGVSGAGQARSAVSRILKAFWKGSHKPQRQ